VAGLTAVLYNARFRVARPDTSAGESVIDEGATMPRGREKDRKTRKKHRKNVQRVKALAKARRAAAKKVKRG